MIIIDIARWSSNFL